MEPSLEHVVRRFSKKNAGASVNSEWRWGPCASDDAQIIPELPQKGFGDSLLYFHVDLTQP